VRGGSYWSRDGGDTGGCSRSFSCLLAVDVANGQVLRTALGGVSRPFSHSSRSWGVLTDLGDMVVTLC
jgi:hypothetical protein